MKKLRNTREPKEFHSPRCFNAVKHLVALSQCDLHTKRRSRWYRTVLSHCVIAWGPCLAHSPSPGTGQGQAAAQAVLTNIVQNTQLSVFQARQSFILDFPG